MPSKKPQVTFRLPEEIKSRLDQAAKELNLTTNELALKAMLAGLEQLCSTSSEQCSTPKPNNDKLSSQSVAPRVCVSQFRVGDKLPIEFELKPAIEQTIRGRKWYIFTDDQLVAVAKKSANGSQKWLEVAIDYPPEVWTVAQSYYHLFDSKPVTTLEEIKVKLDHPAIAEALSKGWDFQDWALQSPESIAKKAEAYLKELAQSETIDPLEEPITTLEPTRLTISELAKKLAKSPREAQTLAATLTNLGGQPMKKDKIATWTASRDPEGLSWLPTDSTREYWVAQVVA